MSSLKKLAIRGTIWTIGSYGASQILRLGSNLILTRLLLPEMFGLISLVFVFISGLHLFSDIGIGPSIIQNKRGEDPAFLNTAWTMQVVRSLVLWLCCLLIAWPVAKFYGEPKFLWLIPVVGLSTLISGFSSTALYTLNRQMAIRELVLFDFLGQIVSIGVMIVWAYFHPSIWALVAGSLVSSVVQTVLSHQLVSERNHFAWDREAAKSIFSFGKWIFISTALTFLALQADRLILGKLISFSMLGVYGIAFTLADIPRQIILALSNKVIFPLVAKLADQPRATFRAKILRNREIILLCLAVGLALLIGWGDQLILILYKPPYHDAAWMLPIIALGVWHTTLYSTMSPALLALGKSNYNALGFLLTFLTISLGLPIGFYHMGMVGALIVIAFYDLPLYGVTVYGAWREGLDCLAQDLQATVLFVSLLASVLFGRILLGWDLPIQQIFSIKQILHN